MCRLVPKDISWYSMILPCSQRPKKPKRPNRSWASHEKVMWSSPVLQGYLDRRWPGSMALGSFWLHVLWAEASRSMSCHRTVCIRMRQSIQHIFQNKFDLLWSVVLCTASSLPPTEKACSDASTDECSSFLQAGCHGLARMRVEDLKFRETSPHWPTRQLNSRRNSWNVRTCAVYSTSNVVCLQI